ncbi:MAG: glutaredoxin family protein [Chloroflexi bacterium]|nr:glutaredoxin family protein [Chloroflexota bacterium]
MPHRVIFYTKPGCHLCEIADQQLRDLAREFQIAIDAQDITRDDALFKKYFDKIPVLIIDDHITLAAPIQIEDIRAALTY